MCQLSPESTLCSHQTPQDLLALYDDFVEFQGSCAFFCDAVTGILDTNVDLDGDTMEGMRSYAANVKQSANELKKRLRIIREPGA